MYRIKDKSLREFVHGPLAIMEHEHPAVHRMIYFPGLLCHDYLGHSDSAALTYGYIALRDGVPQVYGATCFSNEYGVKPGKLHLLDKIHPYSGLLLPSFWMDQVEEPVHKRLIALYGLAYQITGQPNCRNMAHTIFKSQREIMPETKRRIMKDLHRWGLKSTSPNSFMEDLECLIARTVNLRNYAWRIRALLSLDNGMALSKDNRKAMLDIHERTALSFREPSPGQRRYVVSLEIQHLAARERFTDRFLNQSFHGEKHA